MRKIILSINTTIDGYADHTAVIADDELHDFYSRLLDNTDVVLMGRNTYELMASYWPHAEEEPTSTISEINFAGKYNSIHKIVFSKILEKVEWNNSALAKESLNDVVLKLKLQAGKNILAGSLSIASALAEQNLIDEYVFLVHPIILGKGKRLFEQLNNRVKLKFVDSKTFRSGAVMIRYTI